MATFDGAGGALGPPVIDISTPCSGGTASQGAKLEKEDLSYTESPLSFDGFNVGGSRKFRYALKRISEKRVIPFYIKNYIRYHNMLCVI